MDVLRLIIFEGLLEKKTCMEIAALSDYQLTNGNI